MLDLNNIEDAIRAFRYSIEKKELPGIVVEATYASGKDGPFKNIVFTHRILKDEKVICYVTYRSKCSYGGNHPTFSSYQIFNNKFDISTSVKYHLSDAGAKAAFINTVNKVLEFIEEAE